MSANLSTPPSGFFNIDKPLGITSHDVVDRVRRVVKSRQVGHAGTLDPLATGVLIVCVGAATRLSDYVMSDTKSYTAIVQLGIETDTYDAEGAILATADTTHLTLESIEAALALMRGAIQQLPPAYSAIKQNGRKLYELARAGETVIVEPRAVTIHSLTVTAWHPPDLTLTITCSAGTYIRSIAHDLGAALGVGGHLIGLVRTASGNSQTSAFILANAVSLDRLMTSDQPTSFLIDPARALSKYPSITVNAAQVVTIIQGRALPVEDFFPADAGQPPSDPLMAYRETATGAQLVAICELRGDKLHPRKVFVQA